MKGASIYRMTLVGSLLFVVVSAGIVPGSAVAQGVNSEVALARQAACQELQAGFDRILIGHGDQPEIDAVRERLALLGEVADAILHDLRLDRTRAINSGMIAGQGSTEDVHNKPVGAVKIAEMYQANFARPLDVSLLAPSDQQAVLTYLATAEQGTETYIELQGQGCIRVGDSDMSEIVRLCFVLPLLNSRANQDLSAPEVVLPRWMKRPRSIQTLEDFALKCGRPRVAFVLHRTGYSKTPSDISDAYIAFIRISADRLLLKAEYEAGVTCLRDGVAIAESAKMDAARIEFSFRIAAVLDSGHLSSAAADEMLSFRATCAATDDYGRASALRLKYLYDAERFGVVTQEASADLQDARCASYLREIVYIAWLSCRQQDGAKAEFWQRTFLERFPNDPHGADIYLAAATDALVAGRYAEASRLLELIEHQFPKSPTIGKVREIRQRLNSVSTDGATSRGSSSLGG